MKLKYTPRARQRTRYVDSWWRENRPDAPDLFLEELEGAHELLVEQPHTGSIFRSIGEVVIRRMLLRRTRQWLYYSVDEAADVITVHTVWGAERGTSPKL